MTEEEKRTKQAIELYKHFTEVTDIYVATKGYPMPCAVPMLAGLMLISHYAKMSGTTLKETLKKQLEGMERNEG